MKIVLSGATGFIGKPLAFKLAQSGHTLLFLVRSLKSAQGLPGKAIVWDANSPLSDREILAKADAVIHLSGEPIAQKRWNAKFKKKIYDSRILSTRYLVDAIRDLPKADRPKAFLCASAIGIYGDRADEVLTEDSKPGDDFLAKVAIDWEAEAKKTETLGVRAVLMRLGIVLAQGGGALEQMQPVILGNGKSWMSWIHRDDVISLIEFLIDKTDFSGAINFVSPEPLRNKAFTQELARAMHWPMSPAMPALALRAIIGEMAQVVLASTKVKPHVATTLGFEFQFPTLKKAFADLFAGGDSIFEAFQFVPRPLPEVFSFFSKAENLETITPPWLGFKIKKKSTAEIEENTIIDYALSIHGMPVRWQSRIEEWKPQSHFVDTQLKGPYKKWHHTHRFYKVEGGTLIHDRVRYQVPLGNLGNLALGKWIRGDVEKIFKYRTEKINELFSTPAQAF